MATYALEAAIEPAVEAIETLRQKDGESEGKFMERIRAANCAAGGIHDETYLVQRFLRGLAPEVNPLLSKGNRSRDFTTLEDAAEYAGNVSRMVREVSGKAKARPTTTRILPDHAVDVNLVGHPDFTTEYGAPAYPNRSVASSEMVLDDHGHPIFQAPPPPSTAPTPTGSSSVDPDPYEVMVVHTGPPDNLPAWVKPPPHQRPGWVDTGASANTRGPAAEQPTKHSTLAVCSLCSARGHFRSDCPYLERATTSKSMSAFAEIAERNYCALTAVLSPEPRAVSLATFGQNGGRRPKNGGGRSFGTDGLYRRDPGSPGCWHGPHPG